MSVITRRAAVVAGGLTGISILTVVHRKMSNLLDSHPFIQAGLSEAGFPQEAPIGYFKTVHIDDMNSVGYATVTVDGHKVRICGRKILETPHISEPTKSIGFDYDDDLEGEGSGIAFYWENPWEIKASVIRGFRWMKEQIMDQVSAVIGTNTFEDDDGIPEEWEVTSVAVDGNAVLGCLEDHPDFASLKFASINGGKSDYSIKRARIFLSILITSVTFMGLRRSYQSYQMKPSYRFAKKYIFSHPSVREFFREKEIEIVSRTGVFSPKKIDAEITIGAKNDFVEGLVKLEASRSGSSSSDWMMNQATFTPNGAKSIDLLVRK